VESRTGASDASMQANEQQNYFEQGDFIENLLKFYL